MMSKKFWIRYTAAFLAAVLFCGTVSGQALAAGPLGQGMASGTNCSRTRALTTVFILFSREDSCLYRDDADKVPEGAGAGRIYHKEAVQYDTADGGVLPCGQRKNTDSGIGVCISVGG